MEPDTTASNTEKSAQIVPVSTALVAFRIPPYFPSLYSWGGFFCQVPSSPARGLVEPRVDVSLVITMLLQRPASFDDSPAFIEALSCP